MKLEGKTALVTGTSPNIMGGIAEGLAAEGAKTVCVDVNPDYVHGCAQSIARRGGQAIGLVCDITDEAQVITTMDWAERAYGGVDILVNGATVFNLKGVLDMPVEEWRHQTDVLLTGAFLFTKHVAQRMIDQGRQGNVINIISTAGHQGEPGNVGLRNKQGWAAQLHSISGHGAGPIRHPGEQLDSHCHRPQRGRRARRSLGGAMADTPSGATGQRHTGRCQ